MMYARSTTITTQPSSIEEGIRHVRDETMPALLQVEGCVGLSLLVNRDSGQCIATSAWDSPEAMRASEARVGPIRADAGEHFNGSIERVEEWEIAVLHREHHATEGAAVRCTWLSAPVESLEQAIEGFRATVLPGLEQLEGFSSASLFLNRATGRAVSATAWDSRTALQASREQVGQLRTAIADQVGAQVLDIVDFDLAVAHLRVPELA